MEVNGKLNIRIQQTLDDNSTWIGYIEDARRVNEDDIGALYYVVAVIFIYGLSIVMMIASHIRKNKHDNQLRTYLKEMAKLRKDDRREKVLNKINDIANRRQQDAKQKLRGKLKDAPVDSEADSEACQPLVTKDTNEDNTDSVFQQPDCYILADSQCNMDSGRMRSQSFHDNVYKKSSDIRFADGDDNKTVHTDTTPDTKTWPIGSQDSKIVRIQELTSTDCNDHRLIMPPLNTRSPSLNDFQLSPLFERDRATTMHETPPVRWSNQKINSPNDVRIHGISEIKLPLKIGDKKLSWPTNVSVVAEDAVL